MRGRRPEPDAIASQKAAVRSVRDPEPQADAAPAPELAAPVGGPTPPTWLKDNALDLFHSLAPRLVKAKLLSDADLITFARYCRNLARWLKMQDEIDLWSETYTVETASGVVHRPRPQFLIADRLERMLLATEDRFGLNPAERQRIMAARAQTGVSGDLFGAADAKPIGERRSSDPATPPAQPAAPIGSPLGMLN